MSNQPLWLTHIIEILLVLELQLIKKLACLVFFLGPFWNKSFIFLSPKYSKPSEQCHVEDDD